MINMLSPLLRMFRCLCHSLCCPVISQTQTDYREDDGHPKTKDRVSSQCPAGEGRQFVPGSLHLPLCICEFYYRAAVTWQQVTGKSYALGVGLGGH
jgi:hypothetical protein